MTHRELPKLYIKPTCPWCQEALSWFAQEGLDVDVRDVTADPEEYRAMIDASGQTLTPTFVFDEFVVADFDIDEFREELEQVPEIRERLGLPKDDE